MPERPKKFSWTEDDLEKLAKLADSGASAARAAAALNRKILSVRLKAKELGRNFPGLRAIRKQMGSDPRYRSD